MATPLEMNTTELEGLLQDVYDLPDRNSEGSSEPDLVIPIDVPPYYGGGMLRVEDIGEIDWDAVLAAVEKLNNGNTVNVLIKGNYTLDSGNGWPINVFPTSVMIYDSDLFVYCWLPGWNGQGGSVLIRFYPTDQTVSVTSKQFTGTVFE